jgi:hypothetical protein
LEARTAAKLRLERRKKRAKRGIAVSIPDGGTGYGSQFKTTWKKETEDEQGR